MNINYFGMAVWMSIGVSLGALLASAILANKMRSLILHAAAMDSRNEWLRNENKRIAKVIREIDSDISIRTRFEGECA